MKTFLAPILVFLLLISVTNLAMGLLRLRAHDPISYTQNQRAAYYTANHYEGRCDTTMYICTRTDLGHDSLNLPQGILRSYDAFGFSNQTANTQPAILLIGDSFADDPHLPTSKGLQALVNAALGANISYNIGANGCCGFAVYNQLADSYFTQKPKLIVLEMVERALSSHLAKAAKQLQLHSYHTVPYHYAYADLVWGPNFAQLSASHLWRKPSDKPYGAVKSVGGQDIWFLRNKLSHYAQPQSLVQNMRYIQKALATRGIAIVFAIAPDKESLYPSLYGQSQIPAIQALMQQQQLPYLDVLGAMSSTPNNYYYATDTHWNGNAVALFASLIAQYYQVHFLAPTANAPDA
ncbi:MAG: hypothetical protein IT256_00480 [Chitinophagaceae bacterium]|nr:hypothetical protein [Chitinophagaceae bacterium]